MIESKETHDKIIGILREKGPSLPVHISKELEMSSLFVSAFLSELVGEKKIRVSHLKVGGSPLYFLEGQEEKLESFSNYLHPRENEAFMLLKKKKVLRDLDLDPAIRVAIRSIRDFAVGFKRDDEIYWRYVLISEDEGREILEPKIEIAPLPLLETSKPQKEVVTVTKRDNGFENPLVTKEKKKQKPKSEFVLSVINFIRKKGFRIVEEREYKAKECNYVIQIRSELGVINFLCQAKDKKKISESDLKKLLSEAQKIPLPAFIIYNGDLSKKAKEYFQKYGSVLKGVRV